jgi:hypothetical protein
MNADYPIIRRPAAIFYHGGVAGLAVGDFVLPAGGGYVASAPELRQPVVAVSLGGLRRRIEALMLPDDLRVVLQLDRTAQRERDRRRQQAQLSRIAQLDQRTTLPD